MKSSKLFRGLSAVSIFLFFTINGLTVGMFNGAGFINKALNTPTSIYVKRKTEHKKSQPTLRVNSQKI